MMVFHRFLALLLATLAAAMAAHPAAAAPSEEEVKAAVAYNILQFVVWPAAVFPPGQPLTLCVPETSGTAKGLARYEGMRVQGASLSFRVLGRHLDGLAACRAVFVPAGDPYAVLRISAATHGKPVLLIAEGDRVLEQGAGMGISLSGNHVVIDVDLTTLNAAGLVVSSKLLRLARTVVR
ncbi:MAG TPA: YfiR family protein [Rhodocyclaceae bacterium]